MSVTVLIPHYNSSRTLDRGLASVGEQTLQPCEVIVIDDQSGADEWAAVQKLVHHYRYGLNIRAIRMPSNVGPGAARNAGWNEASGDFVAFLDCDDSWYPRKLELQYSWLVSHPDFSMLGNPLSNSYDAGPGYRVSSVGFVREISLWDLLVRNRFSTPGVMLRRDLPLRFAYGGRYSEDYGLWLRIAASGGRLAVATTPLGRLHKARYGESGLSASMIRMSLGELNNYVRLARAGELSPPQAVVGLMISGLRSGRRLIVHRLRRFAS